jgi:hypothetical protein
MNIIINTWKWLGKNSAEIIAFCALLFTAYQVHTSRKHDKLSVRPHLTTYGSRDKCEETGIGRIKFLLFNNGLGPAIIKDSQYTVDKKPVEFKSSKEAGEFLAAILGQRANKIVVSTMPQDYVMSPNEEKIIFDISFKDKNGKTWDEIEDFLDIFALSVKYQSMYGDEYYFCSMADESRLPSRRSLFRSYS